MRTTTCLGVLLAMFAGPSAWSQTLPDAGSLMRQNEQMFRPNPANTARREALAPPMTLDDGLLFESVRLANGVPFVASRFDSMTGALTGVALFKDPKLRKPWFKTQTKDGVATQDLYFWADAQRHGYRCAIDTSVRVGHYDFSGAFGPADTVW